VSATQLDHLVVAAATLDEGVRWWQLNGYPIHYGP